MLRFKQYLNEAFNVPIREPNDIDGYDTSQDKDSLIKLINYLNSLGLDDIPIAGEEMEKFKENNRICKDCKEPLCFGINDKWLCAGCPELPREYNKNGKEKEKQSS